MWSMKYSKANPGGKTRKKKEKNEHTYIANLVHKQGAKE